MTSILLLVTIILGAVVLDLRKRLTRLEERFDTEVPVDEPAPRWSAIIIDDRVAEPCQPIAAALEVSPAHVFAEPDNAPIVAEPESEPLPQPEEELRPGPVFAEPVFAQDAAEEPAAAVPLAAPARSSSGFEDLFGRKLPIWAGGITLVVAAVLFVKYSIDAGLLSPAVRVVLGLFFGAGLIGGAEVARRKAGFVQDDRVAQALAGAGVGSLYAATLAAANLYALVSPGAAFLALSAITALALGLSLRFGAPTAVLGLVGGLAAPALVNTGESSVPLLSGYLALVIGGITLLSRSQRWFWLGVSSLVGGGAWTALLIAMGGLDQLSSLSVGLLVLTLGLGLPIAASADHRGPMLRLIAAIVAALQLALLVATGGYAMLSWGLYGLLSLAFIWLTIRMPSLRAFAAVPLLTSLILAAIWPAPPAASFILVIASIALIFAGSALWRVWRAQTMALDAGQIILTALGGFLVSYSQFNVALPGEDIRFTWIALLFAALPALGAALAWNRAERPDNIGFAMLVLSTGFMAAIAAILGLAAWALPISLALIAAAILLIGERARDKRVRYGALAYLGGGLLVLMGTGELEFARLVMAAPLDPNLHTLLRWSVSLAVTTLFAWRFAGSSIGMTVQGVAAVLAYGLIAQLLPPQWLAIAAAVGMLIATEMMRRRPQLDLRVGAFVLAIIAALWALEPLGRWLLAGVGSLTGEPMLVADLSPLPLALRRLLGPALIGALALWRMRANLPRPVNLVATAQMGVIGLIGAHIVYKQLFAIPDLAAFIRVGLAERTVWEALLIGGGIALARLMPGRKEAIALVALGLAHNLLYSIILHNPLWAEQAVGPLPIANLLLPAFAIAFLTPGLIERLVPTIQPRAQRPTAILRMLVILLFAFATLRQIFSGTMLVGTDVGQSENILWSVVAIALGICYLIWGIRSGQRAWRIGSLLLMLVAVAKVFLFDAAGLEGLLRIISFLALGFSLIGIGWLYSRFLKPDGASPRED